MEIMILDKRQTYLQLAFNSTIYDAYSILSRVPPSPKIIIEAGTPLIKREGIGAVSSLVSYWTSRCRGQSFVPYVVADLKVIDRAETEVAMAVAAGAKGVVCMASAPTSTVRAFLSACKTHGVDSYLDFMGIEHPHKRLRELKTAPDVALLHRGVDEESDKMNRVAFPIHQINKLRGTYNVKIGIAGGDTLREVQSAIFNSADIVVLWKQLFTNQTFDSVVFEDFLKQIK